MAFPKELLSASDQMRRNYFDQLMIAHPRLKGTCEKLIQSIQDPGGSPVILVYGPSGVGKTTLMRKVYDDIIKSMQDELLIHPGRIPLLTLEVEAPSTSQFSWRNYYLHCLEGLRDPLAQRNVVHYDLFGTPVVSRDPRREAELRKTLEVACSHRNPVAFLVDEAQHLAMIGSGKKIRDQLNCIKSLASTTQTIHVLLGTYELQAFRNLSGQLSRRSQDIHFSRYRADDEEDVRCFKNVINSFQQKLPVAQEPDLLTEWEFLYERSIGCVGTLKQWLKRALNVALNDTAQTITLAHLKKTAHTVDQCEKMAAEIIHGEESIEDNPQKRELLQKLIGLVDDDITKKKEVSSKRNSRSVGVRNAGRDVVG